MHQYAGLFLCDIIAQKLFKTRLKEITRMTQRSCNLTNLLGLRAGKVPRAVGTTVAATEAGGRRGAEHYLPSLLGSHQRLKHTACNVRCFPTAACNGLTLPEKF